MKLDRYLWFYSQRVVQQVQGQLPQTIFVREGLFPLINHMNQFHSSENNYMGLHTSKACGKNDTFAVNLEFESIVLLCFAQSIKPLHD